MMARDEAYYNAEKKIQQALQLGATELFLQDMNLTELPESVRGLAQLETLNLHGNQLHELPNSLEEIKQLKIIVLNKNQLKVLPDVIRKLSFLEQLECTGNQITEIPSWIGNLTKLKALWLGGNYGFNLIADLPPSLVQLKHLETLRLDGNPLNPELDEAYKQGLPAVMAYLRAKAEAQITLNEAKLILVGEGEVGKSCLLSALRGEPFVDGLPTTHGIEIKSIQVTDAESSKEIILNGWDFGGQRVYRPTHQLFFSAPAVYLVVWKPREGPQQGFVREWIQLIKRREPSAKIIVVATHGGPSQRQPDINRQELWDLFGHETIVDFLWVESKPDTNGERRGIEELKCAIAKVAAGLPEMGRTVPKSFADVRQTLQDQGKPYLPLEELLGICRAHNMDEDIAKLFVTIEHRLGHLIHYENDPNLGNIVILRPDWLATAMSYVLDDELTRKAHGLVKFSRLGTLWDNPARPPETRYPAALHPIFLRLMERFDLSYRAADPSMKSATDPLSLIGQLVPDLKPEPIIGWFDYPLDGNMEQIQICKIMDKQTGESASAEGLFYQMIVRLHRYSLGRLNYTESVHWQRGLVLDDDYNGRALLEHIGNDVRITVRALYPQGLLTMLTEEVRYLVESFWEGLRCDVMVPCISPCGRDAPGTGLYNVRNLIESKREGQPRFPCPVCNRWQEIDALLLNAPSVQPISTDALLADFARMRDVIYNILPQMAHNQAELVGRFTNVDAGIQRLFSQIEANFNKFMQVYTDEAREGPRLFSFFPLDRSPFNPKGWVRARFRLVLWCEHSHLPLPVLNGPESKKGIYDLELERDWFRKTAPYLKLVTGTLCLVLPVASSALKVIDETGFQNWTNQLDLAKDAIDALAGEGKAINEIFWEVDKTDLEHGVAIRTENAGLRMLHALLKAKDPTFGGLVRVTNKRNEFLWVHPRFAGEY